MKMGIHEWAYDSEVAMDKRYVVPQAEKKLTLSDRKKEVELGFDGLTGFKEAERCLNCDVQTVFTENKCIECDACVWTFVQLPASLLHRVQNRKLIYVSCY
jgi:formate dehydrogenase beta subunit